MKIANLIPLYLAQMKNIELQGLGRFTFNGEEAILSQEDIVFPEGSLQFEADSRTGLSEDLIRYLMEKSGKVRSLVISDLDSFIQLGIQFLNLGKPFEIPGIGQVKRNGNGKFEFMQGPPLRTKIELREPSNRETTSQENNISFRSEKKKAETFRHKNRVIAISILAVFLITYLLIECNRKTTETGNKVKLTAREVPAEKAILNTTPPSQAIAVDSTNPAIDSSMQLMPRGFRIVVKEYNSYSRALAFKRLLERNHEVIVFTGDSIHFKVAIPFDEPVTDTTRIRDSIRSILGIPVYVEIP
jgi:hypothetical protein